MIGDEEWINGEVNTLINIGSTRKVSLSWGSKKKESGNIDGNVLPGDTVIVMNCGSKWEHHAVIISINESTSSAVVKWNSNGKRDMVDLADCVKFNSEGVSERKRKATDFFQNQPLKNHKSDESDYLGRKKTNAKKTLPPGQVLNKFHSLDNFSKLCAEGAIRNLMHMLHHSDDDLNSFWELATTSLPSLQRSLNESSIPASVIHGNKVIDSIEKCLWILRKKFKYNTTTTLKVTRFSSLKMALNALLKIKFPMVISVNSRQATYNHVVVVWQNKVIDFESGHTLPLSEDSLGQVCGIHTSFCNISRGYGLFPSKTIRKMDENSDISDWGLKEYNNWSSDVRKYFV